MAGFTSSLMTSFLSLTRSVVSNEEDWPEDTPAKNEQTTEEEKSAAEQRRLERRREREVARRLRSAQRHTRFVSLMRYALPVTAVLLAIVLLSWPGSNGELPPPPSTISAQREMILPHYRGLNKRGEPLEIQAERAVQTGELESVINLKSLRGHLHRKNGTKITLSAESGKYDQTNNHVLLEGNVQIVDETGYNLVTSRAQIDLSSPAQAWGDAPVSGTGPQGQKIQGNGFRITDEGKTVVLTGRPQLALPPASANQREEN